MYKILGADLKEYGPVSRETIEQWIKEGRANAMTQAMMEGTTDWKPLANIPEFSAHFAAKPQTAPPSSAPSPALPPSPAPAYEAMAQSVIARNVVISGGHCIGRSWALVQEHFWLLVGACFVTQLIQGAVPLLFGVCQGGMFFLFLKLIRRQRGEFSDAFAGFNQGFLQLFLAGLVSTLLIFIGGVFCIIPGIYLGVAWAFAIPLVVDRKMEFWPAMEVSRKVVCANWWPIFGLLVLNILVGLLGFCVCFVGIYVAIPVTIGAIAYAYEDIFGAATVPTANAV